MKTFHVKLTSQIWTQLTSHTKRQLINYNYVHDCISKIGHTTQNNYARILSYNSCRQFTSITLTDGLA